MPNTPAGFLTHVVRTERLTPHLQRVVVGGEQLAAFAANGFTDAYVKLVFPPEERPTIRTYTVRHFDPRTHELTIDFVVHGDEGVAGPWAAAAKPGDELQLRGPGGAYSPRPDADLHLLVGDEAALPAIAAALEALGPDAVAIALIEVDGDDDHLDLTSPADVELRWVHRSGATGDEPLLDAVRSLDLPNGTIHAFVHGELHLTRAIRAHLLDERGLDPELLSASGYWRHGKDEAGFQAEKRELAQAERAASST